MQFNSSADERASGSLPGAAWRAAVLLAVASVLTGLAVSLGLLTAFGPSPDRPMLTSDAPAFRGGIR